MNAKRFTTQIARSISAGLLCTALVVSGSPMLMAQTTPTAPAPAQTVTIPAAQLEAMVAPIALYPDKLLAQVLVASTYPLELVQLQQWLEKNKDLQKDQKKLTEKVAKQPWDPSIQAMAPLPDVVKWMAGDIQWTTDLGNAFLAQQADVMAAVQKMRGVAKEKGALASNEQQKVETQVVESKTVIVIEQSNPQVVYVPSYNPTYVYGAWGYPYPPIYYPPYYGGAYAAAAIGFGVGVAIGAAWGGGWGYGCGWGGNDINVNVNNNFNRNTNIQGGNRNNINNSGNRGQGGNNSWQHNPSHRGGAPYGDRGTADKFGGSARGDSLSNRQSGARNQVGQSGGNLSSANRGGAGASTRDSAPRGGGVSNNMSGGNRPNTSGGGFSGSSASNRAGSTSGNSIGNRSMGSSSSMSNRSSSGGFGSGSSGGWGGSSARSSSSRGSSSMSSMSRGGSSMSRGGGGMSRGGGGGGRRR